MQASAHPHDPLHTRKNVRFSSLAGQAVMGLARPISRGLCSSNSVSSAYEETVGARPFVRLPNRPNLPAWPGTRLLV